MTAKRQGGVALVPRDGIDHIDGRLAATNAEPWLDLVDLEWTRLSGHLVDIVYRASLWDEPARPVFRFRQGDGGVVDRIAVAPIAGAGRWTGRVPVATIGMSVSPTNRIGRFDFAIESITVRSWATLLVRGFRAHPKATRSAILTKLIGWHPESDVNLDWATGASPIHRFASWRGLRERPIDIAGIDRPRFDWTFAAPIGIWIAGDRDSVRAARTRASIAAQVYPHSTIIQAIGDIDGMPEDGIICRLEAGDLLEPGAIAYVAEQARRAPHARIFYGDTIQTAPGGLQRPHLRPGWSPRLQQARPYLGRTIFVRHLAAWTPADRVLFLADGRLPGEILKGLGTEAVKPLFRFIAQTHDADEPAPPPNQPSRRGESAATAAILIPTRDHPALLQRAIASIRAKSRMGVYHIVIVDNGSVTLEAKALLATLRNDADITILPYPAAFNFSAMCNAAAASSRGDVLLFLNDDTEVLSEDWLDRLVGHALDLGVGAVGAKLTYPDGRLQHVGVVVGMGESAGHFGALARGDDPGWCDRDQVVHEVSAVTGACLAVSREKFDAVGGFDAEHLPIELSDIDLCLKLNARGWQTIVDPAVHLMHEESVSRGGATLRRLDIYGAQRAVFIARWRHVIRDDPTFHPGLSLYSWQAALG